MARRSRRVRVFFYTCAVVALAATAWVAVASGSNARAQLVNVRINTASASAEWADIYVAIDKGFFAQNGLHVTPILATQEPGTVLLSGQAEFSSGTPTTTYIDDSAGAKITAFYSPGATYVAWCAKGDIKTPADLKGKTLGVFSLQDLDVIYTTQMMSQYGVKPGDYTMRAVGFSSAKLAAVKAGSVAAAPLYPPTNFQAVSDGLHQIFDTSKLKGGALPTFYIVKRSWAAQHREQVVGFAKALNQAHAWLFKRANKAAAIRIIVKHTGLPAGEATKSYNLFFAHPGVNYSKAGEWKPAAVKAVVPGLIKLKLLKKPYPYAKTVDLSFLRAAGK
jgi:NitT/TauT family transport system substrate-binding protein